MPSYDVAIHGSGIVGRSLALQLASQGLQVALLQPPRPGGRPDLRAYALNAASVALLRRLRVWSALPADAATPVHEMCIHGDAAGSRLEFSAWSQRVDELAHIVDAAALEATLADALRYAPQVHPLDAGTSATAALHAWCDGKHSAGRVQLGVEFTVHRYGQTAIAARLVGSQPHAGIARQWFRSPDVLALLPFDRPQRGCSWGLVWSLPDPQARELLACDAGVFETALQGATGGAAGTLRLAADGERAGWPLMVGHADRLCGPGWVLLGDAAHVVHPLAGQGLNLGLGDVEALARVLAQRESWRALGDTRLLARYARERRAPTQDMAHLTDGLLQLFALDWPGLRELRNRGLDLVDHLPPLKRWLTAHALGT